jgi:hypothetical protein
MRTHTRGSVHAAVRTTANSTICELVAAEHVTGTRIMDLSYAKSMSYRHDVFLS